MYLHDRASARDETADVAIAAGRIVAIGAAHPDFGADLVVDAGVLGSRYLGGGSFSLYQQVGRVHGSPEAVRRADTMFSWHVEPWCPHYF